MYNTLLSFALIVFLGVLFGRLRIGGVDPVSVRLGINALVFSLFLPALCIKTMYASRIDIETLLVPATAWIAIGSGLLVSTGVYRALGGRLKTTSPERGVLVIGASFGNLIFLGLPVLTGLYGPEAAKYALFYELLAATPLLWLVAAPLAAYYGGSTRVSAWESFKTIVLLPPLWGLLAGLLLRTGGVVLPEFVLRALGMLSDLVIPLMMFSIGLVLTLPRVRHTYAVLPAVVIKLAVVPSLSFAAARLLGLEGIALASCLLEGAMPTMVLTLLIAAKFNLDESLAAFLIVVTTALSFVTLPLAGYIAEHLIL